MTEHRVKKIKEIKTDSEVTGSVIHDDILIVSTKDNRFTLINLNSNQEIRRFEMPNVAPIYKIISFNNLLYFGGADFKFYCIDVQGTVKWAHDFQQTITEFYIDQVIDEKSTQVLVCSYDKTFRVLDAESGNYIWAQMASQGVEYANVGRKIDRFVDSVFIGSDDGSVRRLNNKTGEMLAYFESKNVIRSVFSDHEKKFVIAGGDEMKLHILNYLDLKEKSSIQFDTYIWDIIPFKQKLFVQLYSFAFLGELLEESGAPGLVSLNLSSMNSYKIICDSNIHCKILIDSYLFCGTTYGELLVIDLENEVVILKEKIGTFINSISAKKINDHYLIACCDEDLTVRLFEF